MRYIRQLCEKEILGNDENSEKIKKVLIKPVFIELIEKSRRIEDVIDLLFVASNFNLTNEEYQALSHKYETNDPEKFFNYVAFCSNINKAFTTPGIEKAPVTRVQPITQNDTLLARRKYL